MFRFFRTLRQKLLTENRVSKYLLYAVGEIVLVVIGILIALQINDWNERRKNEEKELKALRDLQAEFEEEAEVLRGLFTIKEQASKDLRNYLAEISSDTLAQKEKIRMERPDVASYTWNPSFAILNSILATGALDHFQNDSLKYLLAGWNGFVDKYRMRQSIYDDHIRKLYDIEDIYIPAKVFSEGRYVVSAPTEDIQNVDPLHSRSNLVSDLKYRNALAHTLNTLHIQLIIANQTLMMSQRIQKLIAHELESRHK